MVCVVFFWCMQGRAWCYSGECKDVRGVLLAWHQLASMNSLCVIRVQCSFVVRSILMLMIRHMIACLTCTGAGRWLRC